MSSNSTFSMSITPNFITWVYCPKNFEPKFFWIVHKVLNSIFEFTPLIKLFITICPNKWLHVVLIASNHTFSWSSSLASQTFFYEFFCTSLTILLSSRGVVMRGRPARYSSGSTCTFNLNNFADTLDAELKFICQIWQFRTVFLHIFYCLSASLSFFFN